MKTMMMTVLACVLAVHAAIAGQSAEERGRQKDDIDRTICASVNRKAVLIKDADDFGRRRCKVCGKIIGCFGDHYHRHCIDDRPETTHCKP